jgi:hypothetical protein
MFISG